MTAYTARWILGMLTVVGATASVNAHKLVTVTDPCNFTVIDTVAGTATVVGSIGSGAEDFSVAANGQIFAASDITQCFVHGGAQTLITVDPLTGAGTTIGAIGFVDVDAIAFAPDGTLYGVDSQSDSLLEIDSFTGVGTVVGPVGVPFVGGMAFSPSGILFASAIAGEPTPDPSLLITIDTTTGETTVVGSIGVSGVEGLAFAPDGRLFGISDIALGGSGHLLDIDITTGVGTPLFQVITSGRMDGLAVLPCIDQDSDGFFQLPACGTPRDCNDASPTTYPGAPELCDGYDNDCDNLLDEDETCDRTCDSSEIGEPVVFAPSYSRDPSLAWTGIE